MNPFLVDIICISCWSLLMIVFCFCLGHFGVIKLSDPVINPHFLKEIATLLNKFCPGCKYMKKKQSQSQVQEFPLQIVSCM